MAEAEIIIGNLMLVVGVLTAGFDMGMNGVRYTGWAPWGLLMAGIGLALTYAAMP